jgi:hypothetical protein
MLIILAIVGLVVYMTRPKPALVVPPQVEARSALDSLRGLPEDGRVLSRVSQVLKRYITAAFGLPGEELTTTEFAQAIAAEERVGPELSRIATEFLRECDQRKFAPGRSAPAPVPEGPAAGAVAKALGIIDVAESRRTAYEQAQREAAESGKGDSGKRTEA